MKQSVLKHATLCAGNHASHTLCLKKTSSTFLAVTRERIVRFS